MEQRGGEKRADGLLKMRLCLHLATIYLTSSIKEMVEISNVLAPTSDH
jgi:hypothetical protein